MMKNYDIERKTLEAEELENNLSYLISKGLYMVRCYHLWDKQHIDLDIKIYIKALMKWKLWICRYLLEVLLSIEPSAGILTCHERLTSELKILTASEYTYSEQLLFILQLLKSSKIRVDMMTVHTIHSNIHTTLNILTHLMSNNG